VGGEKKEERTRRRRHGVFKDYLDLLRMGKEKGNVERGGKASRPVSQKKRRVKREDGETKIPRLRPPQQVEEGRKRMELAYASFSSGFRKKREEGKKKKNTKEGIGDCGGSSSAIEIWLASRPERRKKGRKEKKGKGTTTRTWHNIYCV